MMARMGVYFEEEVQRRYPEFGRFARSVPIGLGIERIEIRSDERQELVSTATAMSSSEQHGMSPPSATALDCDRCNFRRSSVKRERLSVRGPASVADQLPRAAIRETLPNGGLYVLNSAK